MRAERSRGLDRVLDLARRLAEEYDEVPLPTVSRAVRSAAETAVAVGADVLTVLPTIERLARENLAAVAAATVTLPGDVARV